MVSGISAYATGDAITKWLVKDYAIAEIIAFRSIIAVIMLVPTLRSGFVATVATGRFGAHMLRTLLILAALGCLLTSMRSLPLAQVTVIFSAGSLMMTALSVPILKEKVEPQRWLAIIVGFYGVVLAAWPEDATYNVGLLAALVGTMLYAVTMVMTSSISKSENTVSIVFWFSALSSIIAGAMMPFQWVTPPASDFALLIALGVLAGAGQWLVTHAIRLAPISLLAPFDYLHLVFATTYGWLLWHDWPSYSTLAGSAVIMVCGFYVARREAIR
jgi:drug/metabolite transporter (DMT)-like permease